MCHSGDLETVKKKIFSITLVNLKHHYLNKSNLKWSTLNSSSFNQTSCSGEKVNMASKAAILDVNIHILPFEQAEPIQ